MLGSLVTTGGLSLARNFLGPRAMYRLFLRLWRSPLFEWRRLPDWRRSGVGGATIMLSLLVVGGVGGLFHY